MGNTCKPMVVSFQCMTKFTTNNKKKRKRWLGATLVAGGGGGACIPSQGSLTSVASDKKPRSTWLIHFLRRVTQLSSHEQSFHHHSKLGLHLDLKNNTSESIYKAETDRYRKQIYGHQRAKGRGGRINQEYGIKRYTILYIKQVNIKDLLCSTGNNIQYLLITYNGK